MSRENWEDLLYRIDRKKVGEFMVLEAVMSKEEIMRIENVCGKEPSLIINKLLQEWPIQRSNLLSAILPQVLNPLASKEELNPAGDTPRRIFPRFWRIIENTENFAIIIDPTMDKNYFDLKILLAGQQRQDTLNTKSEWAYWAFYMPQSLKGIKQIKEDSGIQLSPQMRQMFLRANGSPDIYPYFYALEWLEMGGIANFYSDLLDKVNIKEPIEKLENFVVFYEDGLGNSHGFFPNELNEQVEYRIYEWNHGTLKFSLCASDFATWLEHLEY